LFPELLFDLPLLFLLLAAFYLCLSFTLLLFEKALPGLPFPLLSLLFSLNGA
jgi:hypothetical protein